jgi:hypothetical protein
VDDLHQERRLGTTDAHREVNDLLLSLSRTSRAFRLYDARNTLIRQFLDDLRTRVHAAAKAHGGLELEIEETTILWRDEVVYREADRERSLAFRLFRDGVRALEIGETVDWDELVSLLEVLSVRFVGVRQGEHDVVTMLRACDFQHIQVHSVEGAMEASAERVAGGATQIRRRFEAPADFDLPLPVLEHRKPVTFVQVEYEDRLALADETSAQTLPGHVLVLAHRLLLIARDPEDPGRLEDFAELLGELRDGLLVDASYVEAATLFRMLGQAFPDDRAHGITASFSSPEAMRTVLRGSRDGALDPELLTYLSALKAPSKVADGVVLALAVERGDPARMLGRALLEQLLPHFRERLERWLRAAEPPVAADITRAAAPTVPGATLLALGALGDEGLLALALESMAHVDDSGELTEGLLSLLGNPSMALRMAVVDELARREERSAFDPLLELIESRVAKGVEEDEARCIGRAMAMLLPEVAADEFQRWLRMSGVMSRLVKTREQRMLEWTAVCGLELVDHARYDRELMELARKEKRGPLHELCQTVLVERRRRRRELT